MYMSTSPQPKSSARMVVLLRPSEKKRLQTLAQREQVSSAEILRRSFQAYEQALATDPDGLGGKTIADMNRALDSALEAVRSARVEVAGNLANIAKLKAARA